MTTRSHFVGFSTGSVKGNLQELAQRLSTFQQLGATLIELTAAGLDTVSGCRLIPGRVEELRAILDDYPMHYTMHAPIAINLLDRPRAALHKRAATASIDLAASFGITTVVIHPGRAPLSLWKTEEEKLLDFERKAMLGIASYARERGCVVAFENLCPDRAHFTGEAVSYALDPARLARMLDEVNLPSAVACLDISHAQQATVMLELDLHGCLDTLAPHVRHIHFSDSTGAPSDIVWNDDGDRQFMGVGDMHAPPGWGSIDFKEIAAILRKHVNRAAKKLSIAIELKPNYFHHSASATLTAANHFADSVSRGL